MGENFQFEITKRGKKKAIWRRVLREKKWRPLILTGCGLIILSFAGFAFSFQVDEHNHLLVDTLGFTISVFLIIGVVMLSFVAAFAMRNIKDRLDEILYVKDGKLHQVFFFSVSGGYLKWRAGARALEFIFDLKTIKNAKYDPASGRMELGGPVKEINYSNYKAGIIEEEHMLNLMQEKYSHVFYDYSVPSLHHFLVSCGVKFKEGPIEYSAFDRRP